VNFPKQVKTIQEKKPAYDENTDNNTFIYGCLPSFRPTAAYGLPPTGAAPSNFSHGVTPFTVSINVIISISLIAALIKPAAAADKVYFYIYAHLYFSLLKRDRLFYNKDTT
jgi:hypothetical protein